MDHSTFSIPSLRIEMNGTRLSEAWMVGIRSVEVQQVLGLPSRIELVFSINGDSSGLLQQFAPGSAFTVKVSGFHESLFRGDITALEWRYGSANRRELVVRGYDLLHRMGQRQSLRVFSNLTLIELARQLAGEIGLEAAAPAPGPRWARLYQHRQSDLALLQEAASRCGLYPTLRGPVLSLASLAGDDRDLPLRLGENLIEAHIEMNMLSSCDSLSVVGWDPQRSVPVEARARQSSLADLVTGRAGLLAGGGSSSGDEHPGRSLPDEMAMDSPQAAALAQAELDRRQAARVVLRGLAVGNPSLQPGRSVLVQGLEAAQDGRYVLTEVNHSLDARRGFVSTLSTQPPPPPVRSHAAVATLGIVVQVNDPQQCGRVRVALPAYGEVETDWIGVLSAAAGPGKGLVALPNLGDTVLVLLLHEDPSQGLVLGGLYGQERLEDSGVEDGAVRRFTLRTADGQLIQLDDRSLRLQNRAGSFVELSPDRLHIFSHTPLTIEAPGNSVTIRANQIDFEQG